MGGHIWQTIIVVLMSASGSGIGALGPSPEQVPAAQAPTAQAPADATTHVSVRVAPGRGAADNRQVLDAFERYFEPTIKSFSEAQNFQALSTAICGHVNDEWIKRARERNKLGTEVVPRETTVTLPPCPFFTRGGTITLHDYSSLTETLLREVGQASDDTINRVAAINNTTPGALQNTTAPRTLKVDYLTAPVSHAVKPEFRGRMATVFAGLTTVPGKLSVRTDLVLSLVNENQPQCDVTPPADRYPFDTDAIAEILEFNAAIQKPRIAVVGVIDTGIDKGETRLFLAKGFDGTVGVNMDKTLIGFPTSPTSYANRNHGTHVAGLILGGLHSARLSALVRDRIQLKIINIVSHVVDFNSASNQFVESFPIPLTNLEEAISYAQRDPTIPILNLSVETPMRHETMRKVFADGDYIAVVAAGNASRDIGLQPSYPASWRTHLPQRFLTVAATMPDDTPAPFSNHGPESVDLAAPGCSVPSILPDAGVGVMTGTSQAAPLVTFTAGLLYSDGLSPQELRNRIRSSVRLIAPPLRDRVGAMGVLDIPKAISVHEDLVTLVSGAAPKPGRVDANTCVEVLDNCWPLARIARLVAPGSPAGSGGLAWLYSDDGEVLVRTTAMPTGNLRFRRRGAAQDELIPFAAIAEVMFAVRPR